MNMADLRRRKMKEDKTDSMLWLGFNKILKILIGDKNMEMFMDDAALKVSIFLWLQVDSTAS